MSETMIIKMKKGDIEVTSSLNPIHNFIVSQVLINLDYNNMTIVELENYKVTFSENILTQLEELGYE